ncbi:MAG: DUF2752 domain-containing protein [[Clostridium] fimetarium]|nr:DUF2752 domain-containing protein [Alistipes timonensis]MCM1406694.1 DUF2752 domain-containing protein [[Clostridium] fimetarium]
MKALSSNRYAKAAAFLLGAAALIALWYGVHAATGFMPRCLFRELTGWKCPGCGSQTALMALLGGKPGEAFAANPAIPFYLLYLAAITQPASRRLRKALTSPAALYILAASIAAWTIGRNFFGV